MFVAAFPFLWATITSFKQDSDLYNVDNNPFWFNDPPTLEHVRYLFAETPFPTFVRNTAVVGGCVVLITLLLALPAAYALARLNLKWGGVLGAAIFMVYLVPPSLLFISLSRLVAEPRPAGLEVVPGADLSDHHRAGVPLAAHRVLPLGPA